MNAFKVERSEELAMHPTAKPVAMVADAIRDVTHRNAIVLDFGRSVTTLIAAQKTGRHARLMELDPAYCDTIIRRWEVFTGKNAVLASSDRCFESVTDERNQLQSRAAIGKLYNSLKRSIHMSDDERDGDGKVGPGRPPKERIKLVNISGTGW